MFAVVLIVLTVLLLWAGRWLQERRHKHQLFQRLGIPFVPPHLIFGSDNIIRNSATNPMVVLAEWKKKYGNVFGYYAGPRPTLVVTDLDMVKQILIKEFHNFSNRPNMVLKAEPVISTLVGLRDQRWKDVRSLLAPTLSATKMKLMMDIMNKKVDEMLRIVGQHVDQNKAIECYTTYQGLTLDVICACALVIKSKCQSDQSDELLTSVRGFLKNALNPFVKLAIYFPIFGHLMSYISTKLAFSGRMNNMIVDHLKQIIKLRRSQPQLKSVDVLQLMLDASETIIEEKSATANNAKTAQKKKTLRLTDEEIIANAWVFLLGGFETTANALTFTTFLLAKHKDCQQRLYEEVKSIVKDPQSPVTYEQVSQMSYLDQVLSESLRLYPPVVTFIIREADKDIELGGYSIKKDMGILIPVWDIHRDPLQWPDPDVFDPERFSSSAKASSTRHPMAYLPFGAGPRNCIGMRFGQMEAKLGLARMLLAYELDAVPETLDPPLLVVPTVALNPAEGIYIRALPRN